MSRVPTPVNDFPFGPAFATFSRDGFRPSWQSAGFYDEFRTEAEDHAAHLAGLDDVSAELAGLGCCASCGRQSSGVDLVGQHVQLCDRCLTEAIIERVGVSLVRAVELDLAA